MQTFLPYPDFEKSLSCLDYKRLGKQRLEAKTILGYLDGTYKGSWANHPATIMWQDFQNALKLYYNLCIKEWVNRGYNNTMQPMKIKGKIVLPYWMFRPKFYLSHQSMLKQKDPKFYSFFDIEDNLPYYWPIRKGDT